MSWKCKLKKLEMQTMCGKSEFLFPILLPCSVLFRRLTARCPRYTDRSLALSPARAEPPPGGSCRSTTTSLHFPPLWLCGPLESWQTNCTDSVGEVSSLHPNKTDQCTRVRPNPDSSRFLKCFSRKWFTWSFPSDGESLELERKDAAGRRFKWKEGE